jgi:hypothetical protein
LIVSHPAGKAIVAVALAAALAAATTGCGKSSSSQSSGGSGGSGAETSPTKLLATVEPSGQVTLTTPAGLALTRLHSGWYSVYVTVDAAGGADFHLSGPSVDEVTKSKVPGAVALWGIHLFKGTYHYMNDHDAHATSHVLSVY